MAKYSKALSMNHIRSTQYIDEKKNKIKLHHKTESENLHCNPNRKLVHAKHHKNHNNIQECKYKTVKKSRRRMLGEAGSGPPQ